MKLSGMSKEGVTTGYILNRVEHTNFRQTIINGNQQYVDVIYFYYSYVVRGRTYYAREPLDYSIAIAQQLQQARKAALPYPVTIRYDQNDPAQSVIWFK